MDFPQYRKLSNNKVFYRILAWEVFDELQLIGGQVRCYHYQVDKYPEKLRIKEMLDLTLPGVFVSSPTEFNKWKEKCGLE